MNQFRCLLLALILLAGASILAACLGEPALPALEAEPPATLESPPVNPTVAAAPRLSLGFAAQSFAPSSRAPQIRHDLVGRSDCLMCHKQGIGGAPRLPDAHRGLESSTCLTCHTAPATADLSGEQLYLRLCSRCHGESGEGLFGPAINVRSYLSQVTDDDIREAIVRGRGASEMLAWGDLALLSDRQIDSLVSFIRGWEPTAPQTAAAAVLRAARAIHGDVLQGDVLFAQYCSGCHGPDGSSEVGEGFVLRTAVQLLDDTTLSRQIRGGSQGMPPFHALLTTDDISDVLALMRSWQAGGVAAPGGIDLSGEEIYTRVCARCHGREGQGGIAPALNSREFLAANDDEAIRQWIQRGTLGTSMLSWGDLGLLNDELIDQLVAFIRAWEPDAPSRAALGASGIEVNAALGDSAHGEQLFAQLCSGCHGLRGERVTGGMVLNSPTYLAARTDEMLASQILNGGVQMPSFHAILIRGDVNDLLAYLRSGFGRPQSQTDTPSFAGDIRPILAASCDVCHGAAGGWSGQTYQDVMTSGANAPVVDPGNPDGSLLVQKLRGTQPSGASMPPAQQPLSASEVELIAAWIAAGAPDN